MEVLGTKVVVMVILAVVSFALGTNFIQDLTTVGDGNHLGRLVLRQDVD